MKLFGKNASTIVYAASKIEVSRWMRREAVKLSHVVDPGMRAVHRMVKRRDLHFGGHDYLLVSLPAHSSSHWHTRGESHHERRNKEGAAKSAPRSIPLVISTFHGQCDSPRGRATRPEEAGTDESVGLAHRLSAVTLRVIFGREEEGLSAHRPKPAGAIVDASLSEVLERLTAGR